MISLYKRLIIHNRENELVCGRRTQNAAFVHVYNDKKVNRTVRALTIFCEAQAKPLGTAQTYVFQDVKRTLLSTKCRYQINADIIFKQNNKM